MQKLNLLVLGLLMMPSQTSWSAELQDAIAKNDLTTLTKLVKGGADVNAADDKGTPLEVAVMQRSATAVQLLLESGARVNDVSGNSTFHHAPLYIAASHGDARLVTLLTEHGATVDTRDMQGRTPLMVAAERGFDEVAKALLKAGADPAATCLGGLTALHYAAGAGQVKVVALLLSNGADIDAQHAPDFDTPLHCAILDGRKDTVKFLLAHGANPNLRDGKGRSPIQLSAAADVKSLLKDAGAKN